MKLYLLRSHEDIALVACENEKEAEKEFIKFMGYPPCGDFDYIEEIDEVDNYQVKLVDKIR